MQLKSTILPVLGRRTLKRVVDALEIDVDRRSAEAMRATLSRSRKVTGENLLHHMLKDEIRALCEGIGLPGAGRREERIGQLKHLLQSVTQGLDDGSQIKSRKGGWVVEDRNGLLLTDPSSATWVMSARAKEIPPAVYRTPAAAYLAWMQSKELAKDRNPRTATGT